MIRRNKVCAYCGKILDTKWIWQGRFEFCYNLNDNGTTSLFPVLEWRINWENKPCKCKPPLQ